MKLLGISGTILGAKTAILIEYVLNEVKKNDSNVDVEILDLRNYQLQFCDGRDFSNYNQDTQEVIKKVSQADFYVIGFPVFNGSIPAPLKNVFDLVSPDAFRYKVMGFVANGGTYQHYLVIENQVKPIVGYFRSYVPPSYVYVQQESFNSQNQIIDPDILSRIQALADELLKMQKALGRSFSCNEQ